MQDKAVAGWLTGWPATGYLKKCYLGGANYQISLRP